MYVVVYMANHNIDNTNSILSSPFKKIKLLLNSITKCIKKVFYRTPRLESNVVICGYCKRVNLMNTKDYLNFYVSNRYFLHYLMSKNTLWNNLVNNKNNKSY